ncbi:MAG: alpha/beta hydrolase [Sphingomonadales bacterium]|nr:alpha/beta hydrolase [Sphingomonadales bacterium]
MTMIRDSIEALGEAFTPQQIQGSMAIFAPLLPPVDEATVIRDIAYGPHERHRLDLFGAAPQGEARPIVLYIHGGGFVRGDKGGPGDPYYNNIGAWAARQGWLGVTATYRLAPDHGWPAGSEDIAAAIDWLRAHAAGHGGDPAKIVLVGQSAGAAHVAGYVGGAKFADIAAGALAGAIMLSGLYDIVNLVHGPYETAYFGSDPAQFERQSSIEGLARTTLPCLFTVAEYDPELFQRQAALMIARRVAVQGKWPAFVRLEGQNHITPVHQIGSSADEVGPILARFIQAIIKDKTND